MHLRVLQYISYVYFLFSVDLNKIDKTRFTKLTNTFVIPMMQKLQ